MTRKKTQNENQTKDFLQEKGKRLFNMMNSLIKKELDTLKLSEMEKATIKVSVFDIYKNAEDPEKAYYEMMAYLTEDERLNPVCDKIREKYL